MNTKSIPVTYIIDIAELSLIDANEELLMDEAEALAMTDAGHTCHTHLQSCQQCCHEMLLEEYDIRSVFDEW
jgi:hypothetical protein